jgi:protein ImuB
VYFPHWSTDVTSRVLTKKKEQKDGSVLEVPPILLTSTVSQQPVVQRYCRLAASAGVKGEMPLPLASALTPGAYVAQFDPVRDFQALRTLAVWFLRFSPLVGLDYELLQGSTRDQLLHVDSFHNGIIVDLTGTEKLHGDPLQFSYYIHSLFPHQTKLALAPTIGAAWALSRYYTSPAPLHISLVSDIQARIGFLPVQALRISDATASALFDVGIVFIQDLLALPRRSLAQRFGKFLLYRLEQCLGALEERLHVVAAPHEYSRCRVFEPPLINRKSVTFAIKHLFKDLFNQIHTRRKRARSFLLTLTEVGGKKTRKEFCLATATNELNHLSSIIDPVIDGIAFYGELNRIHIIAQQIEENSSEQKEFSAEKSVEDTAVERKQLMNNFSIRLGKDRISIARIHQSHIPERSFSYSSAINEKVPSKQKRTDLVGTFEHAPSYTFNERPPHLYSHPERISTISMLPDKPPSFIQWRGKKHKIISGLGPERIAPEWWKVNLQEEKFTDRDYFKIQDEHGRWLWVFREQKTMEWFVHGIWV